MALTVKLWTIENESSATEAHKILLHNDNSGVSYSLKQIFFSLDGNNFFWYILNVTSGFPSIADNDCGVFTQSPIEDSDGTAVTSEGTGFSGGDTTAYFHIYLDDDSDWPHPGVSSFLISSGKGSVTHTLDKV